MTRKDIERGKEIDRLFDCIGRGEISADTAKKILVDTVRFVKALDGVNNDKLLDANEMISTALIESTIAHFG